MTKQASKGRSFAERESVLPEFLSILLSSVRLPLLELRRDGDGGVVVVVSRSLNSLNLSIIMKS